ncbi:MAG: hypothetical protein M3336_09670 [Chloroflexota bacterium]|nr:hypothetical protein [Chloroflexota bacterium]
MMQADRLTPSEFCALERELVAGMAMRKKRNVQMGPMQQLKVRLLDQVAAADPDVDGFTAALAEAVQVVSGGTGTGPAQAVASDLHMDWQMACTSPGFVAWLRRMGAPRRDGGPAAVPPANTAAPAPGQEQLT